MSLKLISHVNGDSDLIEAWVKYYILLGIDRFHLVVHGSKDDNSRLLAIKDSYPITLEDSYSGSFHIDEKKRRLDAVLARFTEQWVLLLDSDEFVEFPYKDIKETIRKLESEGANLMAAPMLQRLTVDGSLETPAVIDDPFLRFPICSADLYRRMGVKGDIFKFPLFYCADNTCVAEGGNHHPPRGQEPRATLLSGVTHHFKFRRTVSQRLDSRIHSEHPWRHESVQFRTYLEAHSNRLPLEGAFVYSREELFRRRLLRRLPGSNSTASVATPQPCPDVRISEAAPKHHRAEKEEGKSDTVSDVRSTGRTVMFVLPKGTRSGDFEEHLVMLLRGLNGTVPVIVCFDHETISRHAGEELRTGPTINAVQEPISLREWFRLIRGIRPEIIVFYYNLSTAFSWQALVASVFLGTKRRISIQCVMPQSPPSAVEGNSPREMLRRVGGHWARYRFRVRLTGQILHRIICVSNAVRDSLVKTYGFSRRKTLAIHGGVSTSTFVPCESSRAALRARFEISEEDFLLICIAKLSEEKRVDILIRAVSRVIRQGIACKCIILGDGPLKEMLQKETNVLGLTGHIFFEGFQKEVLPYLQAGSAFILTSETEASQVSVLEAMACGLPCIVTDVAGNAETVTDHVTGLVISVGSLDEAENAILYLATHPRECSEMAVKSREVACRSFDIRSKGEELKAAIFC